MIRYRKYQNKSQMEGVSGKWFLKAVTLESVDLAGLAKHMALHNSGYSKGQILGILTDMVACIKELLLDGYSVKIDDLAIFSIGIKCKGADKSENATPANIVGVTLNARGTGNLYATQREQEAHFKEMEEYSV
ncbi:MAG: DNA-binding protein [Bacteroidaceae bacterium]|nr:DNA-binding protein [Bacteroidaceae bacterium]